jgi:ketosteroid isomerase-like protein
MSPEVSTATPAEAALRSYCERFAARDASGIAGLFGDKALVEIPLLPTGSVYGRVAIKQSFDAITDSLADCSVELRDVVALESMAMGEGHLRASLVDGSTLDFNFGIVVETTENADIARMTEYFDTDPILPLE